MRHATSMPRTSESISARPLAPVCSASASAAEATGPAGWMIVFRCVSSKSNVCDVMPLTSAALAMSTLSARPRMLAWGAGSACDRGKRGFGRFMMRCADRAAEPVVERAMRFVIDRFAPAAARMRDNEFGDDRGDRRGALVGRRSYFGPWPVRGSSAFDDSPSPDQRAAAASRARKSPAWSTSSEGCSRKKNVP